MTESNEYNNNNNRVIRIRIKIEVELSLGKEFKRIAILKHRIKHNTYTYLAIR